MKVRFSFVTNSSSSSFLISGKRGVPFKARIEVDISHLVRTISTVKELETYKHDYWLETEEFEEYKKLLENGQVIHVLHVSSDEGGVEALVHEEGLRGVTLGPGLKVIAENC